MPLTNAQYDEIKRQYDARQLHNQHTAQARRQQIYSQYPRLEELEHAVSSASVCYAKELLGGDPSALSRLKQKLGQYRRERQSILAAAGLDEHSFEPDYTCPDCKDTGYIGRTRCHCLKQAEIDLVYTQSNIKKILGEQNFSNYSFAYYSDGTKDASTGLSPRESARKAVKQALAFIRQFDTQFQNLFLYGETGTGKTFLSNCIAKELLDSGHSVIYLTSFQLVDILEKNKFEKSSDASASAQNIFTCDLLIIDDLGSELPNAFTISQLFLCLNERLLRKHSTIISTNFGLDQLVAVYTERIFSRVISSYTIIKLTGDDIRLQQNDKEL